MTKSIQWKRLGVDALLLLSFVAVASSMLLR
jgi:hypothetical protein